MNGRTILSASNIILLLSLFQIMLHVPNPLQYSFVILDGTGQAFATENFLKPLNLETKICKSLEEFRGHMNQLPADKNGILLITSGSLGIQLKTDFENGTYPQIHSIYIYCQNKAVHQQWASTISKVRKDVRYDQKPSSDARLLSQGP